MHLSSHSWWLHQRTRCPHIWQSQGKHVDGAEVWGRLVVEDRCRLAASAVAHAHKLPQARDGVLVADIRCRLRGSPTDR